MSRSYAVKTNEQKLALSRAFLYLKNIPEFNIFLEFMGEVDQEVTRNLRTLPLDQVPIEQGKAQLLSEIFELFEISDHDNIASLEEVVNGSIANYRIPV